MLYINKNSANDVFLTLRRESSIGNSLTASTQYLFNFKNDTTLYDLYFIPILISSTTNYDAFRVVESGSTYQNLSVGTVHLEPSGFFHYYIYENVTQGNLYLSGTTGTIIRQGKVKVIGSSIPYTYTNATNEVHNTAFDNS